MRSKVLRPSRADSEGRSDCVEEDLGSCERHCSDIFVRPLSYPSEYRGGAVSSLLRRDGNGVPSLGGTSRDVRGEESPAMRVGMICLRPLAGHAVFNSSVYVQVCMAISPYAYCAEWSEAESLSYATCGKRKAQSLESYAVISRLSWQLEPGTNHSLAGENGT